MHSNCNVSAGNKSLAQVIIHFAVHYKWGVFFFPLNTDTSDETSWLRVSPEPADTDC
jgi:hypothetical protein